MQLGTLNIRRTENKNFASCQFHIENDAATSAGGLCMNSEQAISSFVCFMFGYRQSKENYLLTVCFYPDNARDILSRDKWCLQPRSKDKNEAEDNALNFQYTYMMCVCVYNVCCIIPNGTKAQRLDALHGSKMKCLHSPHLLYSPVKKKVYSLSVQGFPYQDIIKNPHLPRL